MPEDDAFFDTNVLLCLLSSDEGKAVRAEALLASGGVISVQVLNEMASITSRKRRMEWDEIREVLSLVRGLCRVVPLTEETHAKGLDIAERHGYSMYDSMILAAAMLAGCTTVYSEDLQDGQRIEDRLTIRNPFATGPAAPSPETPSCTSGKLFQTSSGLDDRS